jgi:hypothetical protein
MFLLCSKHSTGGEINIDETVIKERKGRGQLGDTEVDGRTIFKYTVCERYRI